MFAAGKTAAVSGGAPDDKFNYVTMLLHGDGTNGAQNNTFVDSSSNNFTITRNGNTTQGSFSPYGSNWSNYFDGSGDYLSVANNSALNVLGGSFTIECWFNLSATQRDAGLVSKHDGTGGYILRLDTTFVRFFTSAATIDRTYSFAVGTWYHIAIVSSGTTGTMYINGVAQGATFTTNGTNATSALQIGRTNTITNDFPGYISNVRITNTAVYTGNFTPSTTSLTAVSGTALLTCQSNRFIDTSANAFTITVNGNTSVQRFNPFGASTAYSTSVIGGSGYFDGSGDYLSLANNSNLNLGAGDFTLEAWIYPNTSSGTHIIWSQWNNGGDNATQLLQNGTAFIYRIGATQWTFGSGTVTVGAWMHIAVSRSGSTVRMFVNGAISSTQTDSTDVTTTGATVIGANDTGATPANIFNGYIAGLRQVKGTAVYTSAFTPPTSPPTAITNTQLLTNFTNGAIFDNAMMNDLETVGNAQISTSVKKFGTGSLSFDGSGDWLIMPYGPTQNFGTGNFTIEGWFYLNSLAASYYVPAGTWGSGTSDEWLIQIQNNGSIRFLTTSGSTFYSASITTATWYHIAVVRNGTTVNIYVNGTSVGSYTCSNSLGSVSKTLYIGSQAGTWDWNGYIDDFRITNGHARYTSNFTAPTAAFSDKGPY